MTAVKEKIINAITIMSDNDAEMIWEHISKIITPTWNDIEEEAPDAFDLQMLKAIETDPECHEFTKESEINWNE